MFRQPIESVTLYYLLRFRRHAMQCKILRLTFKLDRFKIKIVLELDVCVWWIVSRLRVLSRFIQDEADEDMTVGAKACEHHIRHGGG
jgi:hypothetical protein